MKKYNDDFTADMVAEHGAWCLERMMGADNPLVPAGSRPIYAAHEQRVRDILLDNERRR
jgi:hypothetical protein